MNVQNISCWYAVGVFPFRTAMTAERMKMGYVEVQTLPACSLFPPGCTVRGHVFHFSEILQVCTNQINLASSAFLHLPCSKDIPAPRKQNHASFGAPWCAHACMGDAFLLPAAWLS